MHHLRSLLSAILRHAIQKGYLTGANPIREASIPSAPEGNETYAYSLPEVLAMLRVLHDPARTIVAVAAFLGLRSGEVRGLEWPDYSGEEIRVLATNLHDLGVPDKTIQAILRHANVNVTMNCYVKSLEAQSIRAMRQLESLVDVKMLPANSGSDF